MYIDNELYFSDNQAITVDVVSTNITDLGAPNAPHLTSDQTIGDATMYLIVVIDVDFATTVSFDISLRSADNVDLVTTPVIHAQRNLILADLKAATAAKSATYIIGSFSGQVNERYLGVFYAVNTSATAGALTAFLTRNPQQSLNDF